MQTFWCYDIWLSRYSGGPRTPLTRNALPRDDAMRHRDVISHPTSIFLDVLPMTVLSMPQTTSFIILRCLPFEIGRGGVNRPPPRTLRAPSEPGPNRVIKSRVSIKQGKRGDTVKRKPTLQCVPYQGEGLHPAEKNPIFSLNR